MLRLLDELNNDAPDESLPADQFQQAFESYTKRVTETREYVKKHHADDELLAGYDKLLGTLDAYKVYLVELGRIENSANEQHADESSQAIASAGKNEVSAGSAMSYFGASNRQSIAAAGAAALGTWVWENHQKGKARNEAKTQAINSARNKFSEALASYQSLCRQTAQRLTSKHGWQPGEAGFDESDEYLSTRARLFKEGNIGGLAQLEQSLQGRRPRDPFVVERKTYLLAMQEDKARTLRLESAKECLQAVSMVPAGTFYDRYRAELLCATGLALESLAGQEIGKEGLMNSASNEAALGVQVWDAALRCQQDFSGELRQHQAWALALSGDLAGALKKAESVAELRRRDALFAYVLACLYSDTGDAANALTWLHEAVVIDGHANVAEIKTDPDLATLRKKRPAEIADLTAVRCEWKLDYGMMNDDLVVTNHSAFALTHLTISGTIQPNGKTWQDLSIDTIPAGSSYRWKKAASVPGSKVNVDASRLQLRCDQGECQMTSGS